MPIILALDASTDACSVALWCDGVMTECFEVSPRSHTKLLLPMVDEILQKADLQPSQISAIAFGAGPGSFTGLRICLGVVQGLAFGWQCPVIPVSTLQAMALGAQRSLQLNKGVPVWVALDARMSEVYTGLYCCDDEGVSALADDVVIVPSQLAEHFMPAFKLMPAANSIEHKESVVAIGSGWHYESMPAVPAESVTLEWYPHAADIARLASITLARGEVVEAAKAEPEYLRNTVSWKKRQLKRPLK